MERFKIIYGTKKNYKPQKEHYLRAFGRLVEKIMDNLQGQEQLDKDTLIKFVFLAVKLYPVMEQDGLTMEEAEVRLNAMSAIMDYMATLTPAEFVQLFPIPKEYDGEKYCQKDYFSTIEMLKEYPTDKEIGEDKIIEFLGEYYNRDIIEFEVGKLSLISHIRKLNGQRGVVEEFCNQNGIPTYSYYEDEGDYGRKWNRQGSKG